MKKIILKVPMKKLLFGDNIPLPTKMKTAKTKVVKGWLCIWPDGSKQMLFKRLKVGSRPSGLEVVPCTISYIIPKKTK